MSLQEECQYLMRAVLGAGEYMDPVEGYLSNKFLPKLLGLEIISRSLRKVPSLVYNRAGIGILKLTEVADRIHRTSLACRERLVDFLINGEALYTIEHRACVTSSSRYRQEIKEEREEAQLDREERNKTNKGWLWLEHARMAGA